MNRTLNTIGFTLSPIIAMYGIAPLYLFNRIPLFQASLFFIGISINIYITWLFVIYFIQRFPKWNNFQLFVSSLLASILTRGIIIFPINYLAHAKVINGIQEVIYLVITSLAINAILIVIIKSILVANLKRDIEKNLQNVKQENAEAQLKVLMQQLQPHFIFNSLSTLKSMIAAEPDNAEKYVIRLSDFLRYTVQASDIELISVEKELQFVKDYIELQKERFEDGFDYEIEVATPCLSMQIPVLALQSVVENIFKHNYFTKQKPLFFSIKSKNETLIIENPKTSVRLTERSQTGLANLTKRFELLVHQPIEIIEIESKFIVKLPLLKK